MVERYSWDIPTRGQGRAVYITRHVMAGPDVDEMHCHDYAEILYAVEGAAEHTVNGVAERFAAGSVIFIRPNDRHQLRVEGGVGFTYHVVGFRVDRLGALVRMFPGAMGGFWDMKAKRLPCVPLTAFQRQWLNAAMEEMIPRAADGFLLTRFLINFTHEMNAVRRDGFAQAPLWLRQALEELQDIRVARQGPRVLAELTGRSFEHVSRILKKSCNLTPSQVVNRVRIENAASRLVLTSDSILQISLDCGYASLGQFYQEFSKVYGLPPRQYRLRNAQSGRTLDREQNA